LHLQGASDETVAAQIAPSPTDPLPLTEEESQEREQLLEQGFSNWNRRDFTSFVRACERYGRQAIPEITKEIEGKTEEEVCCLHQLCSGCDGFKLLHAEHKPNRTAGAAQL